MITKNLLNSTNSAFYFFADTTGNIIPELLAKSSTSNSVTNFCFHYNIFIAGERKDGIAGPQTRGDWVNMVHFYLGTNFVTSIATF